MYAIKTLLKQTGRYIFTSLGIALCVVLMLFLLAIYKGVADGSVRYIKDCDADLWVLQKYSSNILRGTSLMSSNLGNLINETPGVRIAAPVLFFSANIDMPGVMGSIHLTGYDIATGEGGPPEIYKGHGLTDDSQIILDRAFAAKYRIVLNDKIPIKNDTLTVVGLSSGTNMYVYQYAFITLKKAHSLVGFPGIVSCFMVKVEAESDPGVVAKAIRLKMPNVSVFDRDTFLQNNIHEMESGFLPMLFVIAFIGAIVLTSLLSLILSNYILEQREDFAIIKALGAPKGFVSGIVIRTALILSASGMIMAIILFFPLIRIVEKITPEVAAITSSVQILSVLAGLLIISFISSLFPILRLRHIYPLELFK
jgi:putative ABC transport system permease protein